MQHKENRCNYNELRIGDSIISNDGKILTGKGTKLIVINYGIAKIQPATLESDITIYIQKSKSTITLSKDDLKEIFTLIS